MPRSRNGLRLALAATSTAAVAAAALAPAGAQGAGALTIKGRGYGHGIGMSQYGAYGYATHGFSYQDILSRYYTATNLSQLSPAPTVRVLLSGASRATFTGVSRAGKRKLSTKRSYMAASSGARIVLRSAATGKRITTVAAPLRLTPPKGGTFLLRGKATSGKRDGRYRGALEIRPRAGGGVLSINAVGLEDYVRGVVSAESPASWPAEALKAQAVAARTYAVTTNAGSAKDGFDQYADTRSQMYTGISAEYPQTDAAVAATAGQVVTQNGKPVTTFFFSTSGGHTENIEFSFVGSLPQPWLKGVIDPFDDGSPKHTWKPVTLSQKAVTQKLGPLVKGTFQGIKVLQRGTSPRIVRAQVVGSGGVVATTGPELRRRLGLDDTWATFTYVTTEAKAKAPAAEDDATPPAPADPSGGSAFGTPVAPATPATPAPGAPATPATPASPAGGTAPPAAAARAGARTSVLEGTISRAARGDTLRVQQRRAGAWITVSRTSVQAGRKYRATVRGSGTYRVAWADVHGPVVTVR